MPIKLLLSLLIIVSFISCKTAEDIKREQLVETLNSQVQQGQKQSGDVNIKMMEIEDRINRLYGMIEELQHQGAIFSKERADKQEENITSIDQRLKALEESLETQQKNIKQIGTTVNSQKKFFKDITTNLKDLSKKKSSYQQAMSLYSKKKYSDAKPLFEKFLTEKGATAVQKVKSYHALGIIQYEGKKYDEALVYFSKIVTNWPRSSYAPGSLYHIGKSFKGLGKELEAKTSFEQLIQNYPKSKFSSLAKKEIQ